jgi:hypothetical protein
MSDTTPRMPTAMPQMLADALLRCVNGTTAQLRVTGSSTSNDQSEVGLVSTTFYEVVVGPVVMRHLKPDAQQPADTKWELLLSASSVAEQVSALDLSSAQSLFSMTLAVTVGGQGYLIDSISANEAFGQVYLYRLILREAKQQAL